MESTTATTIVKKDALNIGFVGLGWIGLNRMQQLLSHAKIDKVALIEPVKVQRDRALTMANKAQVFTSYQDLLSDDSIDGIVIATPSALHARQAIEALNAQKAVFCQKPLGRNAAEVKAVLQASRKNNKLLAVDLSYRFTKAFKQVYQVLQNGAIGKVFSVELVFHNAYGPDKAWFYDLEKAGGGCILDLGIHLLDMALWGLNFPLITNVSNQRFHQGEKIEKNKPVIEDFATAQLLTQENTVINLQCSWNISAGKDAVISATFYGTKGGVAFKNVKGSFYDFTAERYTGTTTETLAAPPDDWCGKAAIEWADTVRSGTGYDQQSAKELLQLAQTIDRIYG